MGRVLRTCVVACLVGSTWTANSFAQQGRDGLQQPADEPPPSSPPAQQAPPPPENDAAENPRADDPSSEDADTEPPPDTSSDTGPPPGSSAPGANEQAPTVPDSENASTVAPPTLLREVPPLYPAGASEAGTVVLAVTISKNGVVQAVDVLRSVSPAVDEAASTAVQQWRFEPARQNGEAVAARVQVAVRMRPPEPATKTDRQTRPTATEASPRSGRGESGSTRAGAARTPATPSPDEHDHSGPDEEDMHLEVTVHGERALRAERRAASDFFIHREVLDAAPHREGADTLKTVPGLYMGRSEGLAVGHSYTLRGFDAEHGQDIEFTMGGLPLNMPSHIHGQGYVDAGFLIGDTVDQLHVSEGVSDPAQGDFAVAGSIDIGLGVDEGARGLNVRSGYGSFDTFEQTVVWAPKEGHRESFGAAQFRSTDGYGQNRAGESGSGIVQHRFGEGDVRFRAIGFVHGARANLAGVVRKDDIESGTVCFHCVYPYPTAEAQNALSQRLMAGLFADYRGPEHASGSVGFWLGHDNFRIQENFTGFTQTSKALANVSGRGDLIEQRNQTTSFGLNGRYRTEAFEPTSWAHGTFEVGTNGRLDLIDQQQNLLDATVRNQTWDRRIDAGITGLSVSVWGDLDWQLGQRVNARLGVRGTLMSYEVEDRLGNVPPTSRPQDALLPGYRRSALGAVVGPRSSIEVQTLPWLSLLAAYGEGYRSPQARTLADGDPSPFSRVRSGDIGARARFSELLEVTGLGYATHLSDDIAFEAQEGRLERLGPTQRLGVAGHVLTRPTNWLLGSLSVTYVRATLLEPPPATAEEPDPPFVPGEQLPFVPPWVVRLDTSVKRTLLDAVGDLPLVGRAGVGFTFLSPRPLPFSEFADPVAILDASLGLGWGPLDFDLSAFNLMDLDYANEEFVFVSDWNPGALPSRVPARHIAAGPPLTLFATLGVTL